jgi:RNA polymerase sigma-70 factor (ECF subfamily)
VSQNRTLRKELCLEAMRLCNMLLDNERTNQPRVNALMALMCFHSSRFEARENEVGELILYDDQDRSLWNDELISRGAQFMKTASRGNELSKYHLEAGIAYWYTVKEDVKEKWENILQLYNKLL